MDESLCHSWNFRWVGLGWGMGVFQVSLARLTPNQSTFGELHKLLLGHLGTQYASRRQ